MVAVFGRVDNTAFLASDKRIGMVQTDHHCTWLTARQSHVLLSCLLTQGSHAKKTVDSLLKHAGPQNEKKEIRKGEMVAFVF